MLKTEERTFAGSGEADDLTIEVTQLPGIKGRKLLVRLYSVLGPAFAALVEGADGGTGAANVAPDVELDAVSRAMTTLAHSLQEEDLEHVCKVFGATSRVRVGESGFVELTTEMQDLVFAGRYLEMFRWLGFALEVNYSGFFAGLGGAKSVFQRLAKPTAPQSDSPSTSTGKSGESSARSTTT